MTNQGRKWCTAWRSTVYRYCENLVYPRGTRTLNTFHYSKTLTNITSCQVLLSWELIISATLWLINVPERWASIFWALNRAASLATLEDESRCKNRWKGNRTASWMPKHTEYLSIGLYYFDLDELSTDVTHNIGHFRCTLIPQYPK